MSERLRELIADGGVHVIDGAMGTMLYAKGVFFNVCYDSLNLPTPAWFRRSTKPMSVPVPRLSRRTRLEPIR